jgi:hypothetical protein
LEPACCELGNNQLVERREQEAARVLDTDLASIPDDSCETRKVRDQRQAILARPVSGEVARYGVRQSAAEMPLERVGEICAELWGLAFHLLDQRWAAVHAARRADARRLRSRARPRRSRS